MKKSFWTEFKEFAIKGNMIDLAVGVIIGGAFSALVNGFIETLVMPIIGIFLGGVDLSKWVIKLPNIYGGEAIDWQIGAFLTSVLNFLVLALVVFLMVRSINRLRERSKKEEEAAPEEPAAPSNEEVLLTEIRDLLKDQK